MKELLGIDQYQLMTTKALLRYWTLCWIAFSFLEEIRHDLKQNKENQEQLSQEMEIAREYDIYLGNSRKNRHATLGQALRYVQETHQKLFLEWVYHHALSGMPVQDLYALLAA